MKKRGHSEIPISHISVFKPVREFLFLSDRIPAKVKMNLRIPKVIPEPPLFTLIKYARRKRYVTISIDLVPIGSCACTFEVGNCAYDISTFSLGWVQMVP